MNSKTTYLAIWIACLASQWLICYPAIRTGTSLWLLIAILLLALAAFVWKWDQTLRFPNNWLATTILCSGLGLSALSCLVGEASVGCLGLSLTLFAFFATQQDLQRHNLTYLGWVLFPILIAPTLSSDWITFNSQAAIVSVAGNILRMFRTPFVLLDNAIRIPSQTLTIHDAVNAYLGWQAFMLPAVCYSIFLGRNWIITLLNCVSAWCWWFVFHSGLLVATALLRSNGFMLSSVSLLVLCLLATVLLFLSTERGLRGIFAPIEDGSGDSRNANPFVVIWNFIDANDVASGRKHKKRTTSMQLLAIGLFALAAIICQIGQWTGVLDAKEAITPATAVKTQPAIRADRNTCQLGRRPAQANDHFSARSVRCG